MKELEKLMETVKAMMKKTKEEIRDGEKYLKDPILHQFYEGKVPALRKKKQDLMCISNALEEIAAKLANSVEEENEELEEDITEDVSEV